MKIFVNWEDYITYLQQMCRYAREGPTQAQVIVGLSRGGLIPAVYLSHNLGIPMVAFDPHLLHVNGEERGDSIKLPPPLCISLGPLLIVEDISDTGKTFSKCVKFFKNKGFNCETMCIYNNEASTIFNVDYNVKDSEGKWIVFPYEEG